jgi:tRNA-dihydrouridine synthase A
MMDITDRHFRKFCRLLHPGMVLYTEMVTTGAILHGDRPRFLKFDPTEHPIALQLGGSDPQSLAECAKYGEEWGYNEINLNVGCPSDRVQEGRIGACLMAEPELVANCVHVMSEATSIPITVKTRLGIDEDEDFDRLTSFIRLLKDAGAPLITLHARKAWLQGLSPKQNREVPPLRYNWVHQIKELFPELIVEINGGINTDEEVAHHLKMVNSVMLGRAPQNNPWLLRELAYLHGPEEGLPSNRHDALERHSDYIEEELKLGRPLPILIRHLLGLFQGVKGAKRWRQALSSPQSRTFDSWLDLIKLAKDIEISSEI